MAPVGDYNLDMYYETSMGDPDKLSILRSFFGCLVSAVQYLHDSMIRHRDIKPRKVIVKGDRVYLADFGIAL
jgi:serine/threonine protein kinase